MASLTPHDGQSQSLSASENDAIKAYLDAKEAHLYKSTPWEGRLVIKGNAITYKPVQNVWDRFFTAIGWYTEAKDLKKVIEKRIHQTMDVRNVDPRIFSLFKLYVKNNNQVQEFADTAERQFLNLVDKPNVTLKELHPYIQVFSSKHLEQLYENIFENDAGLCLNFLQGLYDSALKDGFSDSMISSIAKLMASIPKEMIVKNKQGFEEIALRVMKRLSQQAQSIISNANENDVAIESKGLSLRLLADVIEIAKKYPDNKEISKKAHEIIHEVSSRIEEGFCMPLDVTNRGAIHSIVLAGEAAPFKDSNGKVSNEILGLLGKGIQGMLSEGYKQAIVANNSQEASRIIQGLPDKLRAKIIIPLMKSQSNDKELLTLFRHFPKSEILPKEYVQKAEMYCERALRIDPKDYDTAEKFLVTLPKDKQLDFTKKFIIEAPGAAIARLIHANGEDVAAAIFKQLTGAQLVSVFGSLSKEEKERYKNDIVDRFQSIATTNGFSDTPLIATFKSLVDFIPPGRFLTTNWMKESSLRDVGPESFFIMLNKLFEYQKNDEVWNEIPKDSLKFNHEALKEFQARLVDSEFIEKGYPTAIGDLRHSVRNDNIQTAFEAGKPIFGTDQQIQYNLHQKIQQSFEQIANKSFKGMRGIANREILLTDRLEHQAHYLEMLFGNSPEVAVNSIMIEKIRRDCVLGYIVRSYVGRGDNCLANSDDILKYL